MQPEAALMQNTCEVVKAFILEKFLPGEDARNLSDDTELKESGILDSLSTLKLVTFLEERFNVELEASDLDAANLSSVASIASLIARKTGGR
jgi:acyl carrier protein